MRSTGIRAINVAEDDALAWVAVSSGSDDIVLATRLGNIARFNERNVQAMGRDAAGVIGIGSPSRATSWWAWRSSRRPRQASSC